MLAAGLLSAARFVLPGRYERRLGEQEVPRSMPDGGARSL